jgi:Protein of unknown function (DUF4038)/Putative collagen-binding domain of a collagenase
MTTGFEFGGRSPIRRRPVLAVLLGLGGLAIGCSVLLLQAPRTGADARGVELAGAERTAISVGGAAVSTVAETAAAFPLLVKPGTRHLFDSAGKPFLVQGEAAWSLIAQLTREEADYYLNDRRRRGFNTILVNLIQASFTTDPPANAYGELPFLMPADYSSPNEAYFAHADWVLRRAAEKGFLVLLTPTYVGPEGDSDGWYHAMLANGPSQLRQYGEYLGRRYRDFTNILWVHGGDYNIPRKELVSAVAQGIRQEDPRALHTAHGSRQTSALDYWQGETWLQVNNVYGALPKDWLHVPVYEVALTQYARPEHMPFFFIEGVYENEHGATERDLRMQAYQAVLSGAVGQIFGNNPVWHFDGWVGPYPYAMDDWFAAPQMGWQRALGSRGAQSMTHLHSLLMSIPWWLLEPDADHSLLTGGLGIKDERAVAARAADRSLALLYLPSHREITVDLGQLAGPEIAARWYDPADGRFAAVDGSPFPAEGSRRFTPERTSNSSGFEDWVLTLQSVPSTSVAKVSEARAQPLGQDP